MKSLKNFFLLPIAVFIFFGFFQNAQAAVLPYTPSDDGINYLIGTALSRINDGNIATTGVDDYQIHPSNAVGRTITMTFASTVDIMNAEFYNRTGCCTERIGGAQMIFKDNLGATIYTYTFANGNNPALVTITDPSGNIPNVKSVELTNFQTTAQNFREIIFNSVEPQPTTLRITEVEYDAVQPGNDTTREWIELYNYGSEDLNLENWTITDANPTTVTLPNLLVPANTHIVLANNPTSFQANYPAVTADVDLSPNLGLSNAGDTLTLRAPNGDEIDFMAWGGASAGWTLATASDAGESICRTNKNIDINIPGDFMVCTQPSPRGDDTTPPMTPMIPDLTTDSGHSTIDNITNISSPSFDLMCTESTSTVNLREGSTILGTFFCNTVGTVSITSTALTDGVHNISYTETDQFGNTSSNSPILSVMIDTIDPAITSFTADTDGAFSVDSPNLEFTGIDTGGSGVFQYEISIDGGAFIAATSPYNPTITPATSHTVVVRVTDNAGNQSSSTIEFPPVVSINSPTTFSNTAIVDSTVMITGPNDIVSVSASANVSNLSCGTFPQSTPVTCTLQVDTGGTVTVNAEDTTGATGLATRDYVIENVVPTIIYNDDIEIGPVAADTIMVSAQDTSGIRSLGYILTTNATCDAATYAAGTETLFNSGDQIINQIDETQNGNHVCVRAEDAAGNIAYQGSSRSLNVDITPPAVSLTNLPTTGPVIMGTGEIGAIINLSLSGGAACSTTVNATGDWMCTLSGTYVDGESATAMATDAAGNIGTTTIANAIDLMAPDSPIVDSPTENPITGSGVAGDTITIIVDSGITCTTIIEPNGTWSCTLSPDPIPGENYSATATDSLGNMSAPTMGVLFLPTPSTSSRGGSKRISQKQLSNLFNNTPVANSLDIKKLQETLIALQKEYDELSQATPCVIHYSRLIRRGTAGDDVRQVQSCMNSLGYTSGPEDGIYGPLTYRGITSYQREKGLVYIDGIVGPETAGELNATTL